MITLHYWPTPNGWKVAIMLEECGLPYTVKAVDIARGDQFAPDFLAISPNGRIPAITDDDAPGGPLSLFESGAILEYLATKSGQLLPADLHGRFNVLQWLYWQVGGLGPMAGQLSHFVNYAPEPMPYPLARYRREYDRLLGVLDRQLKDREWLAGDYSIADIASWPWLVPYKRFGQSLEHLPHVRRWHEAMKSRPAVQRGMALGKEWQRSGPLDERARTALFGEGGTAGK